MALPAPSGQPPMIVAGDPTHDGHVAAPARAPPRSGDRHPVAATGHTPLTTRNGLRFGSQAGAQLRLHHWSVHAALAARNSALVCGLNHAVLNRYPRRLRVNDLQTRLAPRPPGVCCVERATVRC
jgi:hypothetical protein